MEYTTLLIDGDIIAYRAAAASQTTSVLVKHKSGLEKEFKNRTEFKKFLKAKGKEQYIDDYEFEDVQTPEPIEFCLHSIKATLRNLESLTFADKVEIYIGGSSNFRNSLPLPIKYKGNREDTIRPFHLQAARDYLMNVHDGIRAKHIEADDVLNIRGYEELSKGRIAIIGSNDKDTLQSEGLCMYDWTVENPEIIEIPTTGYLVKNKSIIKGCGLKFFAFQLLFGDTADNYHPTDVLPEIKYGQVAAYKDLDHLWEPSEILQKVIDKYKEWYPEKFDYLTWDGKLIKDADWEHMLSMYFKLAYMKRKWTDDSNWKEFFSERGVKL